MPSTPILFFPVDSKHGESIRGYLLRIAEKNGYERANWIGEISVETKKIAGLYGSQLFGRAPSFIKKRAAIAIYTHPTHRSSRVEFSFCPICISSIDYIPFYWESNLYTTCHEHGCFMQTHCSACSRTLQWNRNSFRICVCGASLVETVPTMASDSAVELCRYLAAALCSKYNCQPLGRSFLPSTVLSSKDLNTLINVLGGTAISTRLRMRMQYKFFDFAKSNMDSAELMSRSAWMLDDWPNNFHQFLRNNLVYFDDKRPNDYDPGIYERFVRELRRTCTSADTIFVLDEYRQFALQNLPVVLTRRSTWMTEHDLEQQNVVPGAVAQKILKKSPNKIKRLIQEKTLNGRVKISKSGRQFCIVSRHSLFKFCEISNDDVAEYSARKLLGISKANINKLVKAGCLHVHGQLALFGDKMDKHIFRRGELYEILRRIYSYGKAPSKNEEYVSYSMACKNILTKDEAASFLLGVVNLAVPILQTVPCDDWKLGDANFSKDIFYDWLHKKRQNESSNEMSIQKISTRLSIKEEVAYFLVRNEYIASYFVVVGRRQVRRVTDESIRAFSNKFIAAAEVARELNTSSRSLVERLMRRRVFPSIGPPTNGCRQIFYRRDELMEELRRDSMIPIFALAKPPVTPR